MYLDNWSIKQVIRLRWLQLMELSTENKKKKKELEYNRLQLSKELIYISGIDRTAEAFERLFNSSNINLPIDVKL